MAQKCLVGEARHGTIAINSYILYIICDVTKGADERGKGSHNINVLMPPRKKTVASGAAKKTSPKASPKESPKDKQDSVAAAKLRALEYAKKAFKRSPSPTAAKTNAARASTPTSRRSTGGGTAKGKKRTVDEVEPDVSISLYSLDSLHFN